MPKFRKAIFHRAISPVPDGIEFRLAVQMILQVTGPRTFWPLAILLASYAFRLLLLSIHIDLFRDSSYLLLDSRLRGNGKVESL